MKQFILNLSTSIDLTALLTKVGKRIKTIKFKYEFITSHAARKSGATNMYLAGVDLKFIQDIPGHSKLGIVKFI